MSKINLVAAAAVATEGLKVVGVQFDAHDNAKAYFYLCPQGLEVAVGDFVTVPVGKYSVDTIEGRGEQYANHVKVVRVESVHGTEVIDIYAEYEPRFVMGKLDLEAHAEVTGQLGEIAEKLRVGQTRSAQAQVLAMLGVEKPLTLGQDFTPAGTALGSNPLSGVSE